MNSIPFVKAFILLLLLAPLMAGCDDGPDTDEVRSDFLKEHPGLELLRVHPGLGNEKAQYYQIDYRQKEGGGQGSMRVVYYQNIGDNDWQHGIKSHSRIEKPAPGKNHSREVSTP